MYLVKQYLEELPNTPEKNQIRQFLSEKALHYETKASRLLAAATSSASTTGVPSASTSDSDVNMPVAVAVPIPTPPAVASVPYPAATSAFAYAPITLQQLGTQADARLARAMDLDDRRETKAAIDEYMAAAELYLRCIKIVSEQGRSQMDAVKFKRLLKGALGKQLSSYTQPAIYLCCKLLLTYSPRSLLSKHPDRVEKLKFPTPIRKQILRGLDISPIMSRHF